MSKALYCGKDVTDMDMKALLLEDKERKDHKEYNGHTKGVIPDIPDIGSQDVTMPEIAEAYYAVKLATESFLDAIAETIDEFTDKAGELLDSIDEADYEIAENDVAGSVGLVTGNPCTEELLDNRTALADEYASYRNGFIGAMIAALSDPLITEQGRDMVRSAEIMWFPGTQDVIKAGTDSFARECALEDAGSDMLTRLLVCASDFHAGADALRHTYEAALKLAEGKSPYGTLILGILALNRKAPRDIVSGLRRCGLTEVEALAEKNSGLPESDIY